VIYTDRSMSYPGFGKCFGVIGRAGGALRGSSCLYQVCCASLRLAMFALRYRGMACEPVSWLSSSFYTITLINFHWREKDLHIEDLLHFIPHQLCCILPVVVKFQFYTERF
jgi:hypothetical protein